MSTPKTVVIVLVGEAGCGKSTFINNALGEQLAPVSHGLVAAATSSDVKRYSTVVDGTPVWLVDTPGFNDTYTDDVNALEKIAIWFSNNDLRNLELGGIIYLHDISQNRFRAGGDHTMSPVKFSQTEVVKHAFLHFTSPSPPISEDSFNRKITLFKTVLLKDVITQGLAIAEGYGSIIAINDTQKVQGVVENIVKNAPKMPLLEVEQELKKIAGKVRARAVSKVEKGILSYLFRPIQNMFKARNHDRPA